MSETGQDRNNVTIEDQ